MVHLIPKLYYIYTLALFVEDMAAEPNLLWNIRWDKMQDESGYKHLNRESLVMDTSLPDSKKENRILPIVMTDEPLLFEVECVMDDYDMKGGVPNFRSSFNDQRSENKWTTVIEDKQQALWGTKFTLTKKDFGKQTITCDYEQGTPDQKYYSKSITLTFEIYRTDGECVSSSQPQKCGGGKSIIYQGGQQRNDLVFEPLKQQALKLHQNAEREAQFVDGNPQNSFSICGCPDPSEQKSESASMSSVIVVILVLVIVGAACVLLNYKFKLIDKLKLALNKSTAGGGYSQDMSQQQDVPI